MTNTLLMLIMMCNQKYEYNLKQKNVCINQAVYYSMTTQQIKPKTSKRGVIKI
jgi:hypothetical protein